MNGLGSPTTVSRREGRRKQPPGRWHPGFLPLLAPVLLATCSEAERHDRARAMTRRDSAGIEIVQVVPEGPRTRIVLSDPPRMEVGGWSGDPETELYDVTGAARLTNGRVVIANAGTRELKLFGPNGRLLETVGREGEGPGEFQGIDWITLHSTDSIIAYDRRQNRIQVFDADLELGRMVVLQTPHDLGFAGLAAVGAFRDGTLLARGPELVQRYPREPLFGHLFLFTPDGVLVDSIGPVREAREIWMSGEPWPPFARTPAFVPRNESFFAAASDANEFRRYDRDGRLELMVRTGREPRKVTEEDIEKAMEARPSRGIGEPWIAPHLPFWSEFLVDDDGAVWLRTHPRSGETEVAWEIIDLPAGTVGEMRAPLDLHPLHIGPDFMLVLRSDTLGVERVELFDLFREDPGS